MGKLWPDCIVTTVDVIGIKGLAHTEGSKASGRMRKLHMLAREMIGAGMASHDCCYCWNDSVLLLAMWDGNKLTAQQILGEVSDLKRRIDEEIGRSYAVSVKGRAFPSDSESGGAQSRCIVLKSSSYAMGNCFLIEREARRLGLKDDWYVDSRLRSAIGTRIEGAFSMDLLPRQQRREIIRVRGYIAGAPRLPK